MPRNFHLTAVSIILILSIACLFSCSENTQAVAEAGNGDPDAKEIGRIENPNLDDAELASLVEGNTTFAFDLYQWLLQDNDNLFFSPYSISAALAMTWAGASGQTKTDMASVLHFDLEESTLHEGFNTLDNHFHSLADFVDDNEPLTLNIANSIWLDQVYTINPDFLETVSMNYGASLDILDFISDPEGSRITVNDWIDDRTNGKIPEAVPPGMINELTVMLLVNAIYFYANWDEQFDEGNTYDEPFHFLGGDTVDVPMMHNTEPFFYGEGDGYQVVRLPYVGLGASMIIILPGEGRFTEFEENLHQDTFNAILNGMTSREVRLTFPKFEMNSSFMLSNVLKEMGMASAFSGGFGNMILDPTDLFISEVLHKAFVSVDEAGTEAAAVTVVEMDLGMAPGPDEEPKVFTADRPFIFAIVETETNSILFLGRMLDPS